MKSKKKIIKILVSILTLVLILMGNSIVIADNTYTFSDGHTIYDSDEAKIYGGVCNHENKLTATLPHGDNLTLPNQFKYKSRDLAVYKNMYCVQHDQSLDVYAREVPFLILRATAMVDISGNTARIYSYNNSGEAVYKKTITNRANHIIAGLLSEMEPTTTVTNDPGPDNITTQDSKIYKGYGSIKPIAYDDNGKTKYGNRISYTITQVALYMYYSTWINALGQDIINAGFEDCANGFGLITDANGNITSVEGALSDSHMGDWKITPAKKYINEINSNSKNYHTKIYFLDCFQNDSENNKYADIQNLIITDTDPLIDIPVTKTWIDNEANGNRPGSITVKLYQTINGAKTNTEKTLTLDKGNEWSGIFTDLPTEDNSGNPITYSIEEISVTGYTSTITGNQSQGFTITNTEETTNKIVEKTWNDDNERDKERPDSITVKLYADGVEKATATLPNNGKWSYTFTNLPVYKNKKFVTYTVAETAVNGYEVTQETIDNTYKITNTHIPEKIEIPVEKIWEDEDDKDEKRPEKIEVKLYANGNSTNKTLILNEDNNWKGTFTDLYKYENQELIEYTIEETTVEGYEISIEPPSIKGSDEEGVTTTTGFKITNKHTPSYEGYIEIKGNVWLDTKKGKGNVINGIKEDVESGLEGIRITLKAADGSQFDPTSWDYTDANGNYTIKVNVDINQKVYKLHRDPNLKEQTLKQRLTGAYVEFEYDANKYTTVKDQVQTKKVIDEETKELKDVAAESYEQSKAIENEDARNKFDSKYSTLTVQTKDEQGKTQIDYCDNEKITASTKEIISFGTYSDKSVAKKEETIKYCNGDGTYIRTNPDGAWLEILDGTKDLACENCKGEAIETQSVDVIVYQNVNLGLFEREKPGVALFAELEYAEVLVKQDVYKYDYNYSPIESSESTESTEPSDGENVIYNKESKTYKANEIEEVTRKETEKEINDEIYSNLKEQGYSEEYAIKKAKEEAEIAGKVAGMKAKFQIEESYKYKRPVDPAHIDYGKATGNFSVDVTYSFYIANYSSTLGIEVDYIINTYDSRYKILDEDWVKDENKNYLEPKYSQDWLEYEDEDYNVSLIPKYSKVINKEPLNIKVEPQRRSEYIYITYRVGIDALNDLFNAETTVLNNAMEIHTYTTTYGEETLYAEQQVNGRTGNMYGGYDPNSNPGNAKLIEEVEEYENKNITILKQKEGTKESDTDIAPSFVLQYGEYRQVSGTVWEDSQTEESADNKERLGDGLQEITENVMQNVKVELYDMDNIDEAGNPKLATLYGKDADNNIKTTEAVTYTNENGSYSFVIDNEDIRYGIIPGNYYIKYTYGNADEEHITMINKIDGEETKNVAEEINGRNYKSTIISSDTNSVIYGLFKNNEFDITTEEENWNWPLEVENNAGIETIAIDNMEDRMKITDLTYGTSSEKYNITANSKQFKIGIEFDTENYSGDGKVDVYGAIEGVDNYLDIFNFGIIARPKEELVVSDTVSNITIKLANGQNLINGDPNDGLSYIITPNNKKYDPNDPNSDPNPDPRIITAQIDAELMQAATMYVTYDITVTNNCEIDYDYYEGNVDATNAYSTGKVKKEYYYYGNKEGLTESDYIDVTVPYLASYLTPEFGRITENDDIWETVTAEDLRSKELISEDVRKVLIGDENTTEDDYQVFCTKAFENVLRGESKSVQMKISKVLANEKGSPNYDNNAEILVVGAKIARTASREHIESEEAEEEEDVKIYDNTTPGNYVPGIGPNEFDDDMINVVPSTPLGIGRNIITYIAIGLVGLIVIGVGVIIIKKKVLN